MTTLVVVLALAVAIIAAILGGPAWRQRRRRRLASGPFPPRWRAIIRQQHASYDRMPRIVRERWENAIKVFLAEKRFVGCAGLELSDYMRVTIAAQACLLIANRAGDHYDELRTILLYPTAFRVKMEDWDETGVVTEGEHVLAGESWQEGRVIVSWEDVHRGVRHGGENVVLHEFAHQLDASDGVMDGAPALPSAARYETWAGVLGGEYRALIERAERGDPGLLDDYGATDPAEFFAVATETFFESPAAMRREHAALYAELCAYFRVDPATWGP